VSGRSGGLRIARLLMVVSSLSPLFVLWAIRGTRSVPDTWWIAGCVALVVLPNAALYWRWRVAHRRGDQRTIFVGSARDQSEHLLVYLFAMLIPLYDANLGEPRDVAAVVAAFVFVSLLFWHMNLHYMNLLFAVFGYRVFTVVPLTGSSADAPPSDRSVVVLSKRHVFPPATQLTLVRLSDTVFVEKAGP
jgi:hypothetical protein